MIHIDRMLAPRYMTTMSDGRCAALPANGPALILMRWRVCDQRWLRLSIRL